MATDICVKVGERIQSARIKKGWTQQILADHAELSREHINRVEDGSKELGLRALERIANALEVNACELIK